MARTFDTPRSSSSQFHFQACAPLVHRFSKGSRCDSIATSCSKSACLKSACLRICGAVHPQAEDPSEKCCGCKRWCEPWCEPWPERLGRRLGQVRAGGAEHILECTPERDIDVFDRHRQAEIDQRGDAVARIGDAAGNDRGEMRQVRLDIDGDAV